MNPLVSVIIPVYQAKNYLDACIQSVLNQNYPNIEIILIDDGSTDKSAEKCQFYINSFNNIRGVKQKNKGAAAARNKGIQIAHGKYLYFLDADDELVGNCIDEVVRAIEGGNQWIFFDYYINNISEASDNKRKGPIEYLNKVEGAKRILNVQTSNDMVDGYLWNKFFDSSIIKNNNLHFNENFQMWEDLLFCIQYVLLVDNIVYLHKKLYIYKTTNKNSISSSLSSEAAYSWVKAGIKVKEIVAKNFPEQYNDFIGHLANIIMNYVIVVINHNGEIKDYNKIIQFLNRNKIKLRKKYRFFFNCLRINHKIGFFLIRKLNKLS